MLLKICLTAISLSIIGCNKTPVFPDYNPILLMPSSNRAIQCKLIDREKILFKCEETSIPFDSLTIDGYMATSPEETQNIITWVREMKNYSKKYCKAK